MRYLTSSTTVASLLLASLFLACGETPRRPAEGTGGQPSGGTGTGGAGAAGGQAATGGAPATGTGGGSFTKSSAVIEDVEDGDTSILSVEGRSGSWYGYSDVGTVTLDPAAEGHPGTSMRLAFDAVETGWSGFGFNLKGDGSKEPYDASVYNGISFWIRAGAPISLTFAVADLVTDPAGDICTECHDHWATSVSVTTEWTQVTLHWKDLTRGGWGLPVSEAVILSQLIGLAWNVEAPGTIDVFVDDIAFVKDGVMSPNVTTELPDFGLGGSPNEGEGGLGWVEGGPPSGPSPVEVHGQLHVVEGQLKDEHDVPAALHGQAIAWDNWWPQYHNADVVAWLRNDWCVDVVRPAMGIEPEGAYLDEPAASTARMRAMVEAAIDAGIYVIIDWHAHDLHQAEAEAFFSEMAESYGDSPNVIYEVFNEPETDETWPQVKSYAQAVIAAIRVHDPDNVVIVGTPEWDQRIDLAAADPITSDPNVLYAVHFYAGTHGSWLRTRVSDALELGIPIFVSESGGSEADGMGANDYDEWNAWFAYLAENQISWVNWAIADKEGETVSLLQPGAPASGGWTEADLTPTGVHVRSILRGLNCP